MTWGDANETAETMQAIDYAKARLADFFAGRPVDELHDAEMAYRQVYEDQNNASALGIAEYIHYLIEQRRATA